jgi:hypothetical protein
MVENTSIFRNLPLGKHILYALKNLSPYYLEHHPCKDDVPLCDIIWTIHNRYKYINIYGIGNLIFHRLYEKIKTFDNYLDLSCHTGFMKKNQESILIITHFNDVAHVDSFSKIWELKHVSFLFICTNSIHAPLPEQFTNIQYLIINYDGYSSVLNSFLSASNKYKCNISKIERILTKNKLQVIDNDVQ